MSCMIQQLPLFARAMMAAPDEVKRISFKTVIGRLANSLTQSGFPGPGEIRVVGTMRHSRTSWTGRVAYATEHMA